MLAVTPPAAVFEMSRYLTKAPTKYFYQVAQMQIHLTASLRLI